MGGVEKRRVKARIYTRTGDSGEAGLLTGERVGKDALPLAVFGTLDELMCLLGLMRAEGQSEGDKWAEECDFLLRRQAELFEMNAFFAGAWPERSVRETFFQAAVKYLECSIDSWDAGLPALKDFVIPGSGLFSARLHMARVVTRRAERLVVAWGRFEPRALEALPYLNRLGDAFFVLARYAASKSGEKETAFKILKRKGKRK